MTIASDTIYALSTILGKSGVAIIRVSGPACADIATAYGFAQKISPNRLSRHHLISMADASLIDDCLIAYFKAPHSFTGEDVLEFQTHGSVAIIRKLLAELALFERVRIADPGEFSKRAFMNGKMDLSQAEGLALLIESETEVQRIVAARQMLGEQGSLYEGWRKDLISILAQLEALIDFPTDDLPDGVLDAASAKIAGTLASIRHHLAQGNRSEIIQRGVRVAIIGAPNAGKSTLLNAIARRDVAIISEIAGTTRDVIEVRVDIAGFPFVFYDTAGIRDTVDTIELEGVRRSYRALDDADLGLLVIDSGAPQHPDEIIAHIESLQKPYMTIYNKQDLPMSCRIHTSDKRTSTLSSINLSLTQDASAVDTLLNDLKNYAIQSYTPSSEPLLTSERHRLHLQDASRYLEGFNLEYSIDVASQYIRMAANSLGQITGKIDVEEVLDTIFSSFCIGK